jgi:uncharacterized membrane protein
VPHRPTIDGLSRVEAEIERADPFWPAQVTIAAALALYFALPGKLTLGPSWLIPALEALLLVGLIVSTPRGEMRHSQGRRGIAFVLLGLVSVSNFVSLAFLVHFLVQGGRTGGHALILAGTQVWMTNVLVFALWFWELDRGGPVSRAFDEYPEYDFMFPQMSDPEWAPKGWKPNFVDYLYTSFTNATAFSPTDTMPLTAWAKLLMLVQSLASLVTIGLVAARAVNILG